MVVVMEYVDGNGNDRVGYSSALSFLVRGWGFMIKGLKLGEDVL